MIDFTLSEDQLSIQENIRKLALEQVAPLADRVDKEAYFPHQTFKKLAELGYFGLLIGEEYGGIGACVLSAVIVMEELSYACGSTALSYGAHAFLCTHNLYKNANEEQKRTFLPDLISGKKLGAFAITEPSCGSDALGMKTKATAQGNFYKLKGQKTFITNGPVADIFLVFARTGEGSALSLFVVEKGTKGFEIGKAIHKMGARGSPTCELFFDDCLVPASNLLGEEGGGMFSMLRALDAERCVFTGMMLGLARAAYDQAINYARDREQFGASISTFQLVQEMLVNMAMGIDISRYLTYHAAATTAKGKRATKESSMAKLYSSQMVQQCTYDAIQIFGGYGFTQEYPVERFYRDARLASLGAGTSEIQKQIIADQLLKKRFKRRNNF